MTTKEATRVSIKSYGDYSSDNYGAHSLQVNIGNLELCFSYRTVVAFATPSTGLRVCENHWGTTTGKHLNWIDGGDKKSRIPYSQFQQELQQVLERHSLVC